MYVHEESKLCFLAHPRTASRAVRDALYTIGFELKGSHHDGPDQGYDLSDYSVFFSVRNHWDTLVSWWYNGRMHRKEKKPSLNWLAIHMSNNGAYFRPGRLFWFLGDPRIPDQAFIRYETMNEDLNVILKVHGLPEVEIPVVGASEDRAGRDYREYYDQYTRRFVHWLFAGEIKALDYRFSPEE